MTHPKKTIVEALTALASGMSVADVSKSLDVPTVTIYNWIAKEKDKGKKKTPPNQQAVRDPTTTEILNAISRAINAHVELEKLKHDYARLLSEKLALEQANARLVNESLKPIALKIQEEQEKQQIEERRT